MYDDMPLYEELQKCLSWDAGARPEAAEIALFARAAVEARGIFRKLGEVTLEAEALQCIVNVLTVVGDLDEATREAYDALNISKRANNDEATATFLSLVVATHSTSLIQEDTNKESDAFKEGVKELLGTSEECVRTHKKVKNVSGQAGAVVGLARVQMLAELPDNAKFSADWAYMLYNQVQDGNGFYDACLTLAYAHIMRQDFASAMRYTNEAKEFCIQFQDAMGVTVAADFADKLKESLKLRKDMQNSMKCTTLEMHKLRFR